MRYSPIKILLRNRYTREGAKARKRTVNLEYYHDDVNLGDVLAETVTKYMLERKGLSLSAPLSMHCEPVIVLSPPRSMGSFWQKPTGFPRCF